MMIDDLATELIALKQERLMLQEHINNVEEELAILVGVKSEGSTTKKTEQYTVTTTGKLSRKIDVDSLIAIKDRLPVGVISKVVKSEPKLVLKEYRGLTEDVAAIFNEAIVSSPAKTSVTVKEIE